MAFQNGPDSKGGSAWGQERIVSRQEDTLARTAFRNLLKGAPPDGIRPVDVGGWGEALEQLNQAYAAGGPETVRAVFSSLAAASPELARLVSEDPDTDFLLKESPDDEGNAQCVHKLYSASFAYCPAYGWLYYNGRFWQKEAAEAAVERAIVDTLIRRREAAVWARKEDIVSAAKPSARNVMNCRSLLRSLVVVPVSEFDKVPDYINCNNGVLDLRTGELTAHSPSQYFTYCIPVDYDQSVGCEEWEEFLLSVVDGGPEVVNFLQEAVGYTLTGHTREECLFFIHGPARSGKGTFAETLLEMLGRKPMATQADFHTFTRSRANDANSADLATLKTCRFVVASESGRSQWLNAAKIKQLTGGDDVFCALKYRDHFSYRPQYKIWLFSNHPPKVDVTDDAAWYRIRLIEFPHSHAGREDKLLKERMKAPRMLQQVLAWAVVGAMRWYRRGGLGLEIPQRVKEVTEQARDRIDYVQQWIENCVIRLGNSDAFVPNEDLYPSYKEWCEDQGVTPKGNGSLTQALKSKGYRAGETKKIHGKTHRGCFGIGLLE
jgi:putative DNA primase/helicase